MCNTVYRFIEAILIQRSLVCSNLTKNMELLNSEIHAEVPTTETGTV